MFPWFSHRLTHYILLIAVGSLLFFPNLGGPSLWDIDEGHNVEAGREMMESGNWIVPTFNFLLRVDKPALLYWLQISAFKLFGINEFAGRFPSACAALLSMLFTYELGRRMFGATAGLIAGLMLGTSVLFSAAAHFANPDALLCLCMLLTFFFFWNSFVRGDRSWFVLCGICSGLGMLAKGPIGLLLPSAVGLLFLLWARQLRRLWDWRLLTGMLAFGLVMVPWYAWVGAETRGSYLIEFFLTHNVNRYTNPMEGHTGMPGYYLLVLIVGTAPWSAFLGLALWYSLKRKAGSHVGWVESSRPTDKPEAQARGVLVGLEDSTHPTPSPPTPRLYERHSIAFLWSWVIVYFAFFSVSQTKLPNYVLPIYPAIALLTGRFLEQWRRGDVRPPAWMLHVAPLCLALVGVGTIVAILMLSGAWPPSLARGRVFPGLEKWAFLGILPIIGAVVTWRCLRRGRRTGMIGGFVVSAALFLAMLAAGGASALEPYKAPRELVHEIPIDLTAVEVRVGAYQYFQPSLVFYCRREVQKLNTDAAALEFLNSPLQVYLFLPASAWEQLQPRSPTSCRVLGRRRDLYRNYDIVVVGNR
jgi:4-amino-4-deoxy-L-arabinose transferase-like glycosyltransferase